MSSYLLECTVCCWHQPHFVALFTHVGVGDAIVEWHILLLHVTEHVESHIACALVFGWGEDRNELHVNGSIRVVENSFSSMSVRMYVQYVCMDMDACMYVRHRLYTQVVIWGLYCQWEPANLAGYLFLYMAKMTYLITLFQVLRDETVIQQLTMMLGHIIPIHPQFDFMVYVSRGLCSCMNAQYVRMHV